MRNLFAFIIFFPIDPIFIEFVCLCAQATTDGTIRKFNEDVKESTDII